jgi:two-component system NarL family sensor kinase
LAAAVVFRIATFCIPAGEGFFAMRRLERADYLWSQSGQSIRPSSHSRYDSAMNPAPDTITTERPSLDAGRPGRFDLGFVGATAAVAAVAAVAVAVALAFVIPDIVERHLLEGTANSIHETMHEIVASTDITGDLTAENLGELQSQISRSLLGREVVRVKIWNDSGTIVFSDESRLVGQTYEISDDLREAFSGRLIFETPTLTRPENQFERGLGDLREYYVPFHNSDQGIDFVFEVYELSDNLVDTVDNIRNAIWISLGLGAVALLAALGAATVANARAERRQVARSERLIREILETRDDERTRIIGALHDDIGQPLYRILFGLQASRATLEEGSDVHDELLNLDSLVREVDATLRTELTTLRDEPGIEIDLELALAELVEVAEAETKLEIDFESDVINELPLPHRATLYRAAREALTNVERHAHAVHVTVRLIEGRDSTMVEVIDDGAGSLGDPGLGLTTTRDRLEAIGGGIQVKDAKGGGTRFVAWVPLQQTAT